MRRAGPIVAVGVMVVVAGCGSDRPSGGSAVEVGNAVNYGSYGTTAEIDCADGKALNVGGSNNTLTVRGRCTSVNVGGADNKITLDNVEDDLAVVGLNNTVVYKAGDPTVSNLGTGTLNATLAADQVLISGSDRLIDLDIHLVLADPNSLLNWAVGDAWTVWNWGSITSGNRQLSIASLNAPTLPGGLIWDTTQLNTNGTILIAYVPEPSRALLFLLAITLVAQRRRRE